MPYFRLCVFVSHLAKRDSNNNREGAKELLAGHHGNAMASLEPECGCVTKFFVLWNT